MLLNTYEAAATLTVGTDAFRNERLNVYHKARVLRSVAVVGSAAINDCAVNVYIGDYFVGTFRNTRAGVVAPVHPDDDIPVGNLLIPAGSKMAAIILVAPGTNPLIIQLN